MHLCIRIYNVIFISHIQTLDIIGKRLLHIILHKTVTRYMQHGLEYSISQTLRRSSITIYVCNGQQIRVISRFFAVVNLFGIFIINT